MLSPNNGSDSLSRFHFSQTLGRISPNILRYLTVLPVLHYITDRNEEGGIILYLRQHETNPGTDLEDGGGLT